MTKFLKAKFAADEVVQQAELAFTSAGSRPIGQSPGGYTLLAAPAVGKDSKKEAELSYV